MTNWPITASMLNHTGHNGRDIAQGAEIKEEISITLHLKAQHDKKKTSQQ